MDALKTTTTTFLPNLNMETNVITSSPAVHFCPMCGHQFERGHQVAEHIQLCHGVISSVAPGGGILLTAAPQQQLHNAAAMAAAAVAAANANANESLKIDYPCLNCDDKFLTAEELDEHHRIMHQTAAFLARCLACGIYAISATTLQVGHEYKCMHCGSICTASALAANNIMPATTTTYIEQQQAEAREAATTTTTNSNAHTPEEIQLQQQQEIITHHTTTTSAQDHHQQQQHQRQTKKLNIVGADGVGGLQQQITIKEEPISMHEGLDNTDSTTTTSMYVSGLQQPLVAATSVVVSTAAAAATNSIQIPTIIGGTHPTTNNSSSNNKIRHKCPDCTKTFKTPGTLAMHRKIHTDEHE